MEFANNANSLKDNHHNGSVIGKIFACTVVILDWF